MLISMGMYLPFNTTFAIFMGGLIKFIVDKSAEKKCANEQETTIVENTGLLLASGLVAGEALMGIILAALVVAQVDLQAIVGLVDFDGFWWLGVLVFALLGYVLIKYPLIALQNKKNQSR